MSRSAFLILFAGLLGGCGGNYILTTPDQLAPLGHNAVAVVHLQRNDFFVLSLAVPDAPMRFRVDDGKERGAYTDKHGYAAVSLATPSQPGRYPLKVDLQDSRGVEVSGRAPLYVWHADRPVVAVQFEALPAAGSPQSKAAHQALSQLARGVNLIYMTDQPVDEHPAIHKRLAAEDYPDGPVMQWQRRRWHIDHSGTWPKVSFEPEMVSQLPTLREWFPDLKLGLCRTPAAARAFVDAGLKCILIGDAKADVAARRASWAALAAEGVRTP